MSDIIRRDPRARWIARNRLHPLHAAMQPSQQSWMGPNGVLRKNVHGVGLLAPTALNGLTAVACSKALGASAPRALRSAIAIASGGGACVLHRCGARHGRWRLSSHDRDLLGLAHQLAGADGAVLAVVFGEPKETGFATAGVDRLLRLDGQGYAPEQQVLGLRAVDNQFTPRHWLLPDSRTGGSWGGVWRPA